ncbi:DUF6544 family protein [Rhodococcus phenolicus]|uniref:DUF6544 family protein n=1 Tax=Rhodococcus phenolicus TaxID=263849 RepID=UPI00083126A3|nr:DUF6544 family protein [Rhodococcus phenolicus]
MDGPVFPPPPRSARRVRHEWDALSTLPPSARRFDPEQVANLPSAARRWLTHTLEPGVPLARAVRLTMRGHIRLGSWRPFRATQILAPGVGFVWAATARVAGLPVLGYDRYAEGRGEMNWKLGGLVPVMSAASTDVTTSAAGRLASEFVFVPSIFDDATWHGAGPDTAFATWRIGPHTETVCLEILGDGHPVAVHMDRWGNPNGEPFGRYPFGVDIEAETAFGGITIPTRFRAGWWWGTNRWPEGEFFRAVITGATFR